MHAWRRALAHSLRPPSLIHSSPPVQLLHPPLFYSILPHASSRPRAPRLAHAPATVYAKYNLVLRGSADDPRSALAKRLRALCKGNRYTTTLHVVNSAVVKLSNLMPKAKVYRGVAGMALPREFLQPNEFGVCGGVEMAFMSTSLSREVSERQAVGAWDPPRGSVAMLPRDSLCCPQCPLQHALPSPPRSPPHAGAQAAMNYATPHNADDVAGLLLEMDLSMLSRGADLQWLSQYPGEQEV